jgi:predicted DNA-binding protein (MmcQ/YjbR family)
MTRDEVIERCLALSEASEDYPFGEDVAVFKVSGKMFALVSLDEDPARMTLKCAPERALELRELHAAVRPGYHSNKRHWNTVQLDGTIDDDDLDDMITHSYEQVIKGLPKAEQRRLLGH